MKILNVIICVLIIEFLTWYGYSWSMTANGFPVQGIIGAALPAILFVIGWISGNIHREL